MTIEWNTAWNLGSVSSETVNSRITPLQIIGVIFGVVGLVFFSGCGGWYGSFSGFLHPDACRRERRHSFHHANAGRIRALHDGGFFTQQLVDLTEDTIGCFIHLPDESDEFARIDAGGFRG